MGGARDIPGYFQEYPTFLCTLKYICIYIYLYMYLKYNIYIKKSQIFSYCFVWAIPAVYFFSASLCFALLFLAKSVHFCCFCKSEPNYLFSTHVPIDSKLSHKISKFKSYLTSKLVFKSN